VDHLSYIMLLSSSVGEAVSYLAWFSDVQHDVAISFAHGYLFLHGT
jgi:hypothetical protein